jgi:hypothetical protein
MTFSAHNVVSLFRRPQVRDWDNAELAQFYRVEAALRQAGIFVDTERGLTDEGDPWFVYCRQDSGEVFLHIARFDGVYIAASPSMGTPVLRKKFEELLDELVRDNPVMLAPSRNRRPGTDLYIHPSTMLIAAVAALFYKNAPIRTDDHGESPLRQAEMRGAQGSGILSDIYSVALVSAMAIIAVLHHSHTDESVVDDRHEEELAFLDGILFESGTSQDELPSFEGNVEPTDVITSAAADSGEVVVAEHIVAEQSLNTASALQSLFGKFADTIVAASATVASGASQAVASRHLADPESQTVRDDAQIAEGGEKALPAHGPASSAFVIAAAAAPDFKSQEQAVQPVSLAATEGPAPTDQAVVQLASVTAVPTATDMLAPLDSETSGQTQDDPSNDPTAPTDGVTDGGSVIPEEPPVVETPVPVFYDYVLAGGMLVLLSSSDEPDTAPINDVPGPDDASTVVDVIGISSAIETLSVV